LKYNIIFKKKLESFHIAYSVSLKEAHEKRNGIISVRS